MRRLAVVLALSATAAFAQSGTFTTRSLTPETALKAAQAALAKCRADGFQVAVAVVDRSGVTQVALRDRFAGAHTVGAATDKAWTAVSFRSSTSDLGKISGPHEPSSGVRHFRRVNVVGGGVVIQAQGAQVGGIGVSGAPGGANDEACAMAGIKAIADELEF